MRSWSKPSRCTWWGRCRPGQAARLRSDQRTHPRHGRQSAARAWLPRVSRRTCFTLAFAARRWSSFCRGPRNPHASWSRRASRRWVQAAHRWAGLPPAQATGTAGWGNRGTDHIALRPASNRANCCHSRCRRCSSWQPLWAPRSWSWTPQAAPKRCSSCSAAAWRTRPRSGPQLTPAKPRTWRASWSRVPQMQPTPWRAHPPRGSSRGSSLTGPATATARLLRQTQRRPRPPSTSGCPSSCPPWGPGPPTCAARWRINGSSWRRAWRLPPQKQQPLPRPMRRLPRSRRSPGPGTCQTLRFGPGAAQTRAKHATAAHMQPCSRAAHAARCLRMPAPCGC